MSLYDRFKNAQNATGFNEAIREICERIEALEAAQDHQGGPLVIAPVKRRGRPPKVAA